MTISTTNIKNSYSGNGSQTVFAYTFKILADADIQVIIRAANGTETVKSLTTHYTVSGAGSASGGNVTFTSGNVPTNTETVVIRRTTTKTQAVDLVENDPFTAETVEGAFDRSVMIGQEIDEEVGRSIKLSRTNTMTSTEFTVDATTRANKILAFDGNGEIAVTQELGTYKGNWGASTDYKARDLVKDTSTNNIFIANTAHTSSGSEPLTTNTDSAKWDLLVDAASASTSATAAATSATASANSATASASSATAAAASETAAAASETAAASSETAAASSQSAAATSATAAAGSASAAAATFDLFDDAYLGAKSSNPSVDNDGNALADGALYFDTTNDVMKVYNLGTTTWLQLTPTVSNQNNINSAVANESNINAAVSNASNINSAVSNASNINTVAGISSDVTSVAGISTAVSNVDSNSTNINAVNSNATNINTVAGANSNITSVATNIASVNTAANNLADINAFANIYLGPSSSAPTQDPDGSALDVGDLYFDTTANVMKVYSSGGWITAASAVNGTSNRFHYSISSSTTTVTGADDNSQTLAYDAGFVDVYLNGVRMSEGDVTTTSGTSVVFANAIGASGTDEVDIVAYGTFSLSNFSINEANDVDTSGASVGQFLKWNGTNYVPDTVSTDLVADTTPQLGGNLDLNSNNITGTGNIPAANLTGALPAIDGSALTGIESGIAWQSSIKTASFTAVADEGYWIDTSSNTVTITLPSSASVGDTIELVDYARTWGTNKIIIDSNGLNYQGDPDTFNVEYVTSGQGLRIVYSGATKGWIPTSDDDVTDKPFVSYSIDFLVIAGGGSGGSHHGGGGGAGGYRTSTQTVNVGTPITVTVGDGGALVTVNSGDGNVGSNSSISGTGLTTITSAGGAGGAKGAGATVNGLNGGSGSGGGGHPSTATSGGSGNTPSTSPSQGNNGGNGNGAEPEIGGGGGGAGAVGTNGASGGHGGNGATSSITGSSVTRAGGGGGGARSDGTAGNGGSGGGGAGSNYGSGAATAGTANTGSGGGAGGRLFGTGSTFTNSGAGGKGVVILSVPTSSYTSTTTGSPTVTTSGSNTIMQFNGSGSYTT